MKSMIYLSGFIYLISLMGCAVTSQEVKGKYFEPKQENVPGVILLHGWIGSAERWDYLSRLLKNQGYGVYALDLPQGNENYMVSYVDRAFNSLITRGIDPDRVALIGESTGANLALLYAAKNPKVKTIILLSPGFDFRLPLIGPKHELKKYGNRPILIIASHGDQYRQSPRDSEDLFKWASGKKELKWASRGHGIGMIDREVYEWIFSWLKENL